MQTTLNLNLGTTLGDGSSPYPRRTLRDMDAADRLAQAGRRTLSLKPIFGSLLTVGSGLFALIKRLMKALLRKISFGTASHGEIHSDAAGTPAAMSFTSPEDKTGERSEQAVTQAARDLSAEAVKILKAAPDKKQLRVPGASAYLAMNLQEVGGLVVDSRCELDALNRELKATVAEVAEEFGMDEKATHDYLMGSDFSEDERMQRLSPKNQDLLRRHAECTTNLCRAQIKFCNFAVEGLRAARELGDKSLEQSAKSKIMQFADKRMAEAIFQTNFSESEGDLKSVDAASQSGSEPQAESAQDLQKINPSTSRWVGKSFGVFDEEDPPEEMDSSARRSFSRERQSF